MTARPHGTAGQCPNEPLISEAHEFAPRAKYVARKGEINVWDSPEFVAAEKETGRNTLMLAATIDLATQVRQRRPVAERRLPTNDASPLGRNGTRCEEPAVIKLVGVSGSLRKASFNAALLRAAAELVPHGVDLTIGTIRGIPLYDADLEASDGIPQPVKALKDAIAASDGLLLVTPEYNNSMPGVLKNAIDWLSRPPADIPRVFGDKPVALMGASAGGFGTILSQDAWLSVLRTLGTRPWFGGRLLVSRAQGVFDEAGAMTNEALKEQLRQFVHGFVAFVRSPGPATGEPPA